ncbi:superoxide dismutase family protein [Streptomyces sp. AJS327]|uniref:superoxide dismutase family protein n=1 Tax=Streptomyces sp. AJS327 TaxID=2545265 RepID=UPI0015DEAFCE|nr:superoxide dismutase family protein [Streptomyces sp. AJS327]MBA0050019.1 superoxide dismutase family protein [Streptomyces sp. AJS327]
MTVRTVAAVVTAAVLAVGGATGSAGADQRPGSQPRGGEAGEESGEYWMRARGVFAPPRGSTAPAAVTHDQRRVPKGARIEVVWRVGPLGMTVRLKVSGVAPDRVYGAHVHTGTCGPRPADSGPHYQHREDPRQPSTDPRYANERNEVWLDFRADGEGRGTASTWHEWRFRKGEARSLVLHEHATGTGEGHAGDAGARLACFTVPFDRAPGRSAG